MKKMNAMLSLLSLTSSLLVQAKGLTLYNDSPYKEIFVSNKKHLADDVVSRKTLMKIHEDARKQKSKNANNIEDAIRVTKTIKREGHLSGNWVAVYVPLDARKNTDLFRKSYQFSTRTDDKDNYVKYSNLVRGYATEEERKRRNQGQQRYDIIDMSNAQTAYFCSLRPVNTSLDATETNVQSKQTSKKGAKKTKSSKRKKNNDLFVDQFKGEEVEPANKQTEEDKEFDELVAYPGGNQDDFEGFLP